MGPLAPHTYGQPTLDWATAIRLATPPLFLMVPPPEDPWELPDELPLELPDEGLLLPLDPDEEEVLPAGALFTLSPVSLANVWTPTDPS